MIFAAFIVATPWSILRPLGGPGLVLLGILSSVIPMPGSLDLVTILLSALHRGSWWIYYAGMATLGSVIGGYLTYGLAKKGGRGTLERRLPKKRLAKAGRVFKRFGFGTVFVAAVLPPPFPMVPVLAGAGALKYPLNKFILALALGRGVRFSALAYLGAIYGHATLRLLSRHSQAFMIVLISMAVLATAALVFVVASRKKRARQGNTSQS